MPTPTGGRPRSAFSYLTSRSVRRMHPSEAVGYPTAGRAPARPKAAVAPRAVAASAPARTPTSAFPPGRFAHLLRRPSGPTEEAEARESGDPDTVLARRILTLHAQARGEEPPKHLVRQAPRQRPKERATAGSIIVADLKRRGLL